METLSIVLYDFKSDDIKINIEARFDGDALTVDGYDIGKRVEEFWGDSDYEYQVTVPADEMEKLYNALKISPGKKQELLNELANRFSGNTAYSSFRQFLTDNDIRSEGFTWT
ncbi:MAG TPA: hypothetical protein VL443_01260 [Cyclobacteriaceae bacterium]|jgi:hypothetical protein|nr:hypothetical protein [Cyclobacteriaceae bacterium]